MAHASAIQLPDNFRLVLNWKNDDGVIIFRHGIILKRFDAIVFLLLILDRGLSFVVISLQAFFFVVDFLIEIYSMQG